MVKTEFFETRADGVKLYRTYSDDEKMELLQNETGQRYGEAIDVEGAPYTYTEVEREKSEEHAS